MISGSFEDEKRPFFSCLDRLRNVVTVIPLNVLFHIRCDSSVPFLGFPPSSKLSLRANAYKITASWKAVTKLFTCAWTEERTDIGNQVLPL